MGTAAARASLEIPPDPAFVATARIFGSALARHFGVGEPAIEDIKLAVSEACALLIRAGSGGSVSLSAEALGDRLGFQVSGGALPPGNVQDDTPTPSGLPAVLGMELILGLFEDAALSSEDERSTISFSLALEG
jgi:hypothetical protein